MKITLADGTSADVLFSFGGVTNNCGMMQLYGFRLLLPSVKSKSGWDQQPPNEEVRRQYVANEQLIVDTVVASLQNKYKMYVLSDKMLDRVAGKEGAVRNSRPDRVEQKSGAIYLEPIGTGDLIASLVKLRVGSITLSPLHQNYTYSRGTHEIQAAFWIPPDGVEGILLEGRALPSNPPVSRESPEAVEAYNRWMYGRD